MRILGLCHDVLICSACLVEDGRVVAAIAEERLDRVKRSRVFPVLAAERCLELAGTTLDAVDEIAVAWNPALEMETTPSGWLGARRWRSEHAYQVPSRLLRLAGRPGGATMQHTDLWDDAPPVTYVDHYLAHAANAIFLSPFDEAAVVAMDGRGEKRTGILGRARGAEIEVIEETLFPHSLGLFYGALTQFLGFQPDGDEWKVMALASFADAENAYLDRVRSLVRVDDRGRVHLALDHFQHYNFWDPRLYSDLLVELLGPPRAPSAALEPRHEQIAAALQRTFEEVMARVLTVLHERTGLRRVAVSGGCFMNSVFNGKITELTPFEEVFVGSCPDDSGTSIGAALWVHAERTGERPASGIRHNSWGVGYSDAECLDVAERYKLPNARVVPDPAAAAAADLVAGRLVGWFQGRQEFGQRALGNRSILADPRQPGAKDQINAAVKFRESFRPFAPAILAERVSDYFECEPGLAVPFMERVLPFREEKKAEVPAVVHADGSGRLQTVDEHASARYRDLILAFEARTGVPLVLNTSFNLNGEPVVTSPEDAIRTFFSCGLDVLYLGTVRISKTPEDAQVDRAGSHRSAQPLGA